MLCCRRHHCRRHRQHHHQYEPPCKISGLQLNKQPSYGSWYERRHLIIVQTPHFELQLEFGLYNHLKIYQYYGHSVPLRTYNNNSSQRFKNFTKNSSKILEKKHSRENFQKKILEFFLKCKKRKKQKNSLKKLKWSLDTAIVLVIFI